MVVSQLTHAVGVLDLHDGAGSRLAAEAGPVTTRLRLPSKGQCRVPPIPVRDVHDERFMGKPRPLAQLCRVELKAWRPNHPEDRCRSLDGLGEGAGVPAALLRAHWLPVRSERGRAGGGADARCDRLSPPEYIEDPAASRVPSRSRGRSRRRVGAAQRCCWCSSRPRRSNRRAKGTGRPAGRRGGLIVQR